MDDLIDKLLCLFYGYTEAKKELQECVLGCEYDSDYFCLQYRQDVDEYKGEIKDTIVEIVRQAGAE